MAKVATAHTLREYVQGVSGLFGLTSKESDILAALIFLMEQENLVQITPHIKLTVAHTQNYPIQVVTNYIKKLRDKKALTANNELNPIFINREIVIRYAEAKKG